MSTINSVSQQHASVLLYKSVYISQKKSFCIYIIIKNIDHSKANFTIQAVYQIYIYYAVSIDHYCL
jgi:hypothetical protein